MVLSNANDLIGEILSLFIQLNWELRWFYLGALAIGLSLLMILGD